MNKRIYIVEDDENIREMIQMALRSFSYDVAPFDNAEDALAALESNTLPALVIFDIMLPKMSGLDATRKLRESSKTKKIPVMLLTAKDTEIDKVAGLDAGADDYITKPFSVMELAARIRSIFRRMNDEAEQTAHEMKASDFTLNAETREVHQNGTLVDLTFKEFELLRALIHEKNRIIPREELLSRIWGYDFVGESRTLDIHIRTLRQKIGDHAEKPKYIKTVRNVGYRFIGE